MVALAAGAIGSFLTALLAFGGRVTRIGREIEANTRAIAIEDRHLETWVSDSTIELVRMLRGIEDELIATNRLSGANYDPPAWRAKELALQAYRDQERTSLARVADIRAREGALHGLVRAWRFQQLETELQSPVRALPILEQWASPPSLPPRGRPRRMRAQIVSDPRHRTIGSTLAFLENYPDAIT